MKIYIKSKYKNKRTLSVNEWHEKKNQLISIASSNEIFFHFILICFRWVITVFFEMTCIQFYFISSLTFNWSESENWKKMKKKKKKLLVFNFLLFFLTEIHKASFLLFEQFNSFAFIFMFSGINIILLRLCLKGKHY